MSNVRVRFAPSPTGLLHIGGARTALFNWLYARHTGGTFVLRIEDTDAARNTPEARAIIFRGLKWLGLDWDEGPDEDGSTRGDRGPYSQSQRGDIYRGYIKRLLDEGKAYEFEGAVKFRTPKTICTVPDLICGDVQFDRTNDPDLVIARKDGSPVFHLVNVVDDLEMGITHVIRGEDHLSNTPKHLALFEALGATPPRYAHIPLILNTNGSKMSKRDEGASVGEYIEQGYLPAAVRNYLCLLGWSPKDNREVIDIAEVVERFDLPQVNRSNARFDINKLYWINGEYWQAMDAAAFETFSRDFLTQKNALPSGTDPDYLSRSLAIIREKIKIGRDLPEWIAPFLNEEFAYDAKAAEKNLAQPEAYARVGKLKEVFASQTDWTAAPLEAALVKAAEDEGVKTAFYVHPCRVAVSGTAVGPSLYHMLEVMGRERVLRRIDRSLARFAKV
ncbi:MAG: glutamate--tRNA ligase family protein [Candidatus Methylacidiphilales bacterium]|nr:glutamate--tRNA ligase family protein [Candidatus Methylacidiphilales bacterium]